MRRHRRLVVTERVIPFLAAFVGLLALAGAVIVEMDAQRRDQRVSEELAGLRAAIDLLGERAEAAAGVSADDGVAQDLAALQERMDRIEQAGVSRRPPAASVGADTDATAAAADAGSAAPPEIDPNLPVTDCIPPGTRFMGVSGESYPICQSPAVVRVGSVSSDSVVVEGAGLVTEATSAVLAGTNCTLMVFSAEIEGFAEMRVTCQ